MSHFSRISAASQRSANGCQGSTENPGATLELEKAYGQKRDMVYKGLGYAAFCDPPGVSDTVPKVTYYTFKIGERVIRLRPDKIPELLRKTPL